MPNSALRISGQGTGFNLKLLPSNFEDLVRLDKLF